MIHRLALPVIAAVLTGCTHGPVNTDPVNTALMVPRDQMAQDFIPDQAPLEPPNTRDLQKYILTLPVFEMAPKDERIHWVTSNAVRTNTENSFVIIGDGAQSSVTLERLSAITEPSQRIRVTVEAQGGGGDPVYDLERVQGGWRHLAGPVRKSNKSWMATANSSSASPSAHLNRAVPSH